MQYCESDDRYLDTAKSKKAMSRINMAFFALILFSQLSGLVINALINAFLPTVAQLSWYEYILSALSFYIFGAGACLLILRLSPPCRIEKRPMPLSEVVKLTIMAWGLMLAGSIVGNAVNALIGSVTGVYSSNYASDSILSSGWAPTFVYTVILAPIVEEIVCRRMIAGRTAWLGQGGVVIMCGLVFGLFHGNLYQFFYAFAVGALFGYVYMQTGQLKYSVIMHMIMNFMGGFLPLLIMNGLDDVVGGGTQALTEAINSGLLPQLALYLLYVIFEYALGIAGIVLLVLNFKKMRASMGQWNIRPKERLAVLLGNPGGILMLASAVAVMVYTYIVA